MKNHIQSVSAVQEGEAFSERRSFNFGNFFYPFYPQKCVKPLITLCNLKVFKEFYKTPAEFKRKLPEILTFRFFLNYCNQRRNIITKIGEFHLNMGRYLKRVSLHTPLQGGLLCTIIQNKGLHGSQTKKNSIFLRRLFQHKKNIQYQPKVFQQNCV